MATLSPSLRLLTGKQQPWAWDDVMDLDEDMLVHAVAWMTLSSDDINSGAAQDQQNLADDRFSEITMNLCTQEDYPEFNGWRDSLLLVSEQP